jgi:hypothetical protein
VSLNVDPGDTIPDPFKIDVDAVYAFVEEIVDDAAIDKRRVNLTEGVRWRNRTMRRLRELLGKE